jgi:hypothetical protein
MGLVGRWPVGRWAGGPAHWWVGESARWAGSGMGTGPRFGGVDQDRIRDRGSRSSSGPRLKIEFKTEFNVKITYEATFETESEVESAPKIKFGSRSRSATDHDPLSERGRIEFRCEVEVIRKITFRIECGGLERSVESPSSESSDDSSDQVSNT